MNACRTRVTPCSHDFTDMHVFKFMSLIDIDGLDLGGR